MKFGAFFLSQAPDGVFTPAQALSNELGQMQLAEDLGFDSVWLAEHHKSTYCVVNDTLTYASHVAAVTNRVRIGLGVSVLPLRNPIEFAERAALVDILSGGRLDVGVGRGYSRTEFAMFGVPMDDRRERFEEALDIVLRAWTDDHFDWDGNYYQFQNVALIPKPVQEPHPPVFLASSGTPETIEAIARRGLPFLVSEDFLTPARMGIHLQTYRNIAAQSGTACPVIEDSIARSRLMQKVHLAETTAAAREFARPYALWRYQKVHEEMRPNAARPTLVKKLRRKAPALKHVLTAPRLKDPDEVTGDDLVSHDLFGTPDDCIATLKQFEAVGVRNIICWFSYGGMPNEAVRRSMKLFAREVMPAFERSQMVFA